MTSLLHRTRQPLLACCAVLLLGVLASGQSLTTTFASNNGSAGNCFDIKALNNILITGIDANFDGTTTLEVWAVTSGGTYLGKEADTANWNTNWTLLGSAANLTSNGANVATPLPIPLNYLVTAGSIQGLCVTVNGGSINYTNGTGSTQGTLYTSNSDLEIYEGHGGAYQNYNIQPRVWNGTIYYSVVSQTDDVAITAITAPTGDAPGCELLSAAEPISIDIRNLGNNPVPAGTLLTLSYVIDGGAPVTEFIITPSVLNLGDSMPYTFMATADLSGIGNHTIDVTVTYTGDLDPSNDSRSTTAASGGGARISTFPHAENFDSALADNTTMPPAGWTQDGTDATGTNSDWYFKNTGTPSVGTGPDGDHTTGVGGGGFYAYVEDASNFTAVNLVSPCIDLATLVSPKMSFWLHSNNNTNPTTNLENFLAVDVISAPGMVTTMDVVTPIGHQGSNWSVQIVDLTAFSGQTIQVRFRGQSSGGGANHDIAIDDIGIYEPQVTIGQAPQAGIATLDINGALNVNTSPVSIGANGPYFATVDVGGIMNIDIGGEPNSPVALLAGPLTPVAATYPNVGQLDIGGAVNPSTGIPSSIVVIGDGFSPFTFINAIFNTGPAGNLNLGLQIPPLPAGNLATFQSLNATTNGFFFAITNAVSVDIN